MIKRILSTLLTVVLLCNFISSVSVFAAEPETVEIGNEYIKVCVSRENGGYVITTAEGDILKKSDNDVRLTHRGENMDTSFTSFRIGDKDYVFGNHYGFLGLSGGDVVTAVDPAGNYITSTWTVNNFEIEQKITLVESEQSEQLGTAMISYTVRNNGTADTTVKSRVLMDTQLGENDFGYYEVPNQNLGQGYEYFEFERTWDSVQDPTVRMPADYFVRDNPYSSNIVGYGINSVFEDQKPYKMTFAHWSNIAATKFDYVPDTSLNFTNPINDTKTADSAIALYYDLGSIAANSEKNFSTYYGVTANLKNKDNQILINTTAPSKLEFTDGGRTDYKGSEAEVGDNIVRINTTITNPSTSTKDYSNLAVVVYTTGFKAQRQTDAGAWIEYSNVNPLFTDVVDFKSGENRVTYFDFKFSPEERTQLGSFVTKVFNMDESVNELGAYAEEFCLGTTENFVVLPGKNESLPAITLASLSPEISYNKDVRYLTITGQGMSLFKSDLLNAVELRGDDGTVYTVPTTNINYTQTEDGSQATEATLMLTDYMKPGRYQLHFVWKSDTGREELQGVPSDFTSSAMYVQMSSDTQYINNVYGIVTVQKDTNNKYKVIAYKNENMLAADNVSDEDLLMSFRGDIQQDNANKNLYRLMGRDKNINISHILNYYGSDFSIEQKSDGTVEILMDGKITTVGANTTVRDGTAAFRLTAGTEYVIPVYNERGEIQSGDSLSNGQSYLELKWDNAMDTMRTIGGFLIDLKYGVMGKIQNSDGTTSDIISFGGGLDLSFITPGAAQAYREDKADYSKSDGWDVYDIKLWKRDPATGKMVQTKNHVEKAPTTRVPEKVEAGAQIHDVLYGGQNPGYLGINMDAHVTLPNIVSFLPNKIEAELGINTIGGYNVSFDGNVKTATMEMAISLVVKSNPSGAPIPDKLYFTIGGFEPGFNVDGMGVFWVTGGGGGFDNLYETIYGKDGIPPLTLLLNVQFDITKIMTGSADLELSLRNIKITLDDVSLKMVTDARILDGGLVAVGWYPNFSLELEANVNYAQLLQGTFSISAAAGGNVADFVEFVLRVSIGLPKVIPIVGGMQLASAELGGGSEKVWGSIELLQLLKLGFTYYWGADVEFYWGSSNGANPFSLQSDDAGEMRSMRLFAKFSEPTLVGEDEETGAKQYMSVGSNLQFKAGSRLASDFDALLNAEKQSGRMKLLSVEPKETTIVTNDTRDKHLVKFGEAEDYIMSVSRADGTEITEAEIKGAMTMKNASTGEKYPLIYYVSPGNHATDAEKTEALNAANVNIAGGVAYIVVPKNDLSSNKSFVVEFNDNNAYDIGAIRVNSISELTSYNAALEGNKLNVSWDGANLSDTAEIIVSVSDIAETNGIILNTQTVKANAKNAAFDIPDTLASGEYYVTVALSDENLCYEKYNAGTISYANSKAPSAPKAVSVQNIGNNKLLVDITAPESTDKLEGYFVDVYEGETLVDTGLYFTKEQVENGEAIIGGVYDVPIFEVDGKTPKLDFEGNAMYQKIGYTAGKQYFVKVRSAATEDIDPDTTGDEIYHCSSYVNSSAVELKAETLPNITIGYDVTTGKAVITSDTDVTGELYINNTVTDGAWYAFTMPFKSITQELNLPDGNHTLEFHAVDSDGDKVIIKQIVSVDTTPPTLLLEAPVSGGVFGGTELNIRAKADNDATYTFKLNGNAVTPTNNELFKNGLLDAKLPLGEYADLASLTLDIIATDAAGNTTEKMIDLTNIKLASVKEISITSKSNPAENGKIVLTQGSSTPLSVVGILADGTKLDLTETNGTLIEVTGGTSASLSGTSVTAQRGGRTMLSASYDIGGGKNLVDGIVVETAETIDKVSLGKEIDDAKAITNVGYTESTWKALQNAISSAEDVYNDKNASREMIDNALSILSDAVAGLTKKGGNSGNSGSTSTSKYTVSFNTNGGSQIASQVVSRGKFVTKPENPVREGYTFDGWFTNKELTKEYDFEAEVVKAFTLYAKWTANEVPNTQWKNIFTDVAANAWYYDNVKYANENGLMKGVSETEFAPDLELTRGMFVTILYRLEGEPAVNKSIPCADVDANAYYANAVIWAQQNGIVNGVTENAFAPDNNITREQIAAIMFRYAKYKGYNVSVGENTNILSYTDFDEISEYAISAMQYAVGSGLMNGKTESTINPKDNATRAEIAAILQRFIEANK